MHCKWIVSITTIEAWPFLFWVENTDALQMNREHQLRPGHFCLELLHHKTMEGQLETRYSLACKGTEVRLTKPTLVGSSYFLYMERCYTCQKCVASLVFPVCVLLIHGTSLLPRREVTLVCKGCNVEEDSFESTQFSFRIGFCPRWHQRSAYTLHLIFQQSL